MPVTCAALLHSSTGCAEPNASKSVGTVTAFLYEMCVSPGRFPNTLEVEQTLLACGLNLTGVSRVLQLEAENASLRAELCSLHANPWRGPTHAPVGQKSARA
jgi:hypothetical protein